MTTTIKVPRKELINRLASIKEDTVSIADISINRRDLLAALKLQTQAGAEVLTINYGTVSWHYDYEHHASVQGRGGSSRSRLLRLGIAPPIYDDSDGNDSPPAAAPESVWEYKPYDFTPHKCVQICCDHTTLRFLDRSADGRQAKSVAALNFVEHQQDAPELTGIPVDSRELLNALLFVLPAVAKAEDRPPLACVLFDSSDDTLRLVAADGFRLAVSAIPAKGIPTDKVLIRDIPRLLTFLKSIKAIGRGKMRYYPSVYVTYDYKTITFACESNSLTLDKQTWHFPDYPQLVPTTGTHIECVASEMLHAADALKSIASDGSGIIRLQFGKEGTARLSARGEESGEASVECLAKVQTDCRIAVNGEYLRSFLALCKDDVIDIFLTTPSSPIVIHDTPERYYVIMPMFVQW